MSSSHGRAASPVGRRIVSGGRTSTGSFVNKSAYYDYPAPPRSSRDYVAGPRTSTDRADGPKVVTLRQRSPPRKPRDDDYEVRPRPRTTSLDPGDSRSRRPLSLIDPKSPNKSTRPIITKDVERPPSPVSKSGGAQLEASYIMPASSSSGRHHHRHSSLTAGDRLAMKGQDRGERLYPVGRSYLPPPPPLSKPARDEHDYGYEYTTPREEVLRDLAPRQRPSRGSYTSARPTSMVNLERSDRGYGRTDRDAPPPASTRGFENVGQSDSVRQNTRSRDDGFSRRDSVARGYSRGNRDDGRYREPVRAHVATREEYVPYPEEDLRHSRPRKPTLEDERPMQKVRDPVDERYSRVEDRPRRHHHREHDQRKDYDEREERDRRPDYEDRDRRVRDEPRPRRENREEADSSSGLIAGAGTTAAAGMAAEGVRRHRHRDEEPRSSKDSSGYIRQPDQASETASVSGDARLSGGHEDDEREERRRRRRKEREREDRDYREACEESQSRAQDPTLSRTDDGAQLVAPPTDERIPQNQKTYERRPDVESDDELKRRHVHRHRHQRSQSRASNSYSDLSSDSDSSTKRLPRQPPQAVTLSNDSAEAAPKPVPKGILKPPREKFPEEPSTVREGVAPLDAAKKGIPPEARWTRINRRLVNPEALEMEGVRFEEFADHVIVLKVLSPEEIAKFTKLTHEIRERRRLEQGDGGSGSGSGGGGGVSEGGS